MIKKAEFNVIVSILLKGLREDIPKALSLVKSFNILGHYKNYLKKMYLYREKIIYRKEE